MSKQAAKDKIQKLVLSRELMKFHFRTVILAYLKENLKIKNKASSTHLYTVGKRAIDLLVFKRICAVGYVKQKLSFCDDVENIIILQGFLSLDIARITSYKVVKNKLEPIGSDIEFIEGEPFAFIHVSKYHLLIEIFVP